MSGRRLGCRPRRRPRRWSAAALLGTTWLLALCWVSRPPAAGLRMASSLSPPPGPAVMASDINLGNGQPWGALLLAGDGTTWSWDPAALSWTERAGADAGPGARLGASMAYGGSFVLLFGGRTAAGYQNDTWAWGQVPGTSREGWTRLSPGVSPSARAGAAMAFIGSGILLFGGETTACGGCALTADGDTWEFASNTWSPQPAGGPSPRTGASLASSPGGQDILLFGGHDAQGTPLGDAWTYRSSWSPLSTTLPGGSPPPLPSARSGAAAGSDGCFDVLFSGAGAPADTWKNLTQSVPGTPHPSARTAAGAAYTEVPQPGGGLVRAMVLFGGSDDASLAPLGDTWTFGPSGASCSGEAWTLRNDGTGSGPPTDPSQSAGSYPGPPDPPRFPANTRTTSATGSAGPGTRRAFQVPGPGSARGGVPIADARVTPQLPTSGPSPASEATPDGGGGGAPPTGDAPAPGSSGRWLLVSLVAMVILGAGPLAWVCIPGVRRAPAALLRIARIAPPGDASRS